MSDSYTIRSDEAFYSPAEPRARIKVRLTLDRLAKLLIDHGFPLDTKVVRIDRDMLDLDTDCFTVVMETDSAPPQLSGCPIPFADPADLWRITSGAGAEDEAEGTA